MWSRTLLLCTAWLGALCVCPPNDGTDPCMDRLVGLQDAVPSFCRLGQEPPNNEMYIQSVYFSRCRAAGGAFEDCRFQLDNTHEATSFTNAPGTPRNQFEVISGTGAVRASAIHIDGSGFEMSMEFGGGGSLAERILRQLKAQCYTDHSNPFADAVDLDRQCHFGTITGQMVGYGNCEGARADVVGYPINAPKQPSVGCGADQKSHTEEGLSSWFGLVPTVAAVDWPASCVIPFLSIIQGDLNMDFSEGEPVQEVSSSPSPSPSPAPMDCNRTCPTCSRSPDLTPVAAGTWQVTFVSREFDGTETTFRWRLTASLLAIREWVVGFCRHVNLVPMPFVASARLECDSTTGLFGLRWESWLNLGEEREFTLRLPGDIPVVTVPYTIRLETEYAMGETQGPRSLCPDEMPPDACTCRAWKSILSHISDQWCDQNCCPYKVLHMACNPTVGPPHRVCRCKAF